ncbi:MAG: hypothetical protein H6622_11255 [Halobacteriovoraceae bacterium]|nr:hypothetical protein [Halobacteriovoraceae bacterium]
MKKFFTGVLFSLVTVSPLFANTIQQEFLGRMNAIMKKAMADKGIYSELTSVNLVVDSMNVSSVSESEFITIKTHKGNTYTLEKAAVKQEIQGLPPRFQTVTNFYPFGFVSEFSTEDVNLNIVKVDDNSYMQSYIEQGFTYTIVCDLGSVDAYTCNISTDNPDVKSVRMEGLYKGVAGSNLIQEVLEEVDQTCLIDQGKLACLGIFLDEFKQEILDSI